MSDGAYCKTVCEHCGKRIEFPQTASGETVDCPHCRNNIFLPYGLPTVVEQPPLPALSSKMSGIADLEFMVRQMMQNDFLKDPTTAGVKIKNFSLVHEFGNKYRGIMETQNGQNADVDVTHDGRNIIWQIVRTHEKKSSSPKSEFATSLFWLVIAVVLMVFNRNAIYADWQEAYGWFVNQSSGQPYRASVETYLKARANDPSSLEIISISSPANGELGRYVTCTYRAKNGFGALTLGSIKLYLNSDNQVTGSFDEN